MIRSKNGTEYLLLSITKNCETFKDQTHRKAEEILEFKMTNPRQTFHFNPAVEVREEWMIGLINLEVYNYIFNLTEENNKFELNNFPDQRSDGVSYVKVGDEIERDLDISDITVTDLKDEIIAPNLIEEYRAKVTKRMKVMDICFCKRVMLVLCFKILKVFSERNLIWLKMILDWFQMNIIQVL